MPGPSLPTRRSLRAAQDEPSGTDEPVLPPEDLEIELELSPLDATSVPAMVAAASFADTTASAPAVASEAPVIARETPLAQPAAEAPSAPETPDASVPVVLPPAVPALGWVDEQTVLRSARPALPLEAAGAVSFTPVAADLLARAPRRTPWRPGVLAPVFLIVAVIAVYCGATLLWPLHAVAPTVQQFAAQPIAAAPATPAWPAEGSAAIAVDGVGPSVASTADARSIASITKVVTALLVLEEMPLAVGEQGIDYRFTSADRSSYWRYRDNGESALDVPVGGSLTQYQMLQGMLIGSANNYADRLASTVWASDALFSRAANDWLAAHGVTGITIADPTGIEAENIASPEALITLAQRALANPVIAEIVRTPEVELPGAGVVRNTNNLLADPGVVGIKTGSLDAFNLLAAKDVTVGSTTVRVYASALGQPDVAARDAAVRALFAQVEQELQPLPSVTQGTSVGQVETRWGTTVPILTAADASVVLWNGGSASVDTTFSLGDAREEGAVVGTLVATGPKDSASVDLVLAGEIDEPSPWWRLTHPLQLFGLA